MKFLVPNYSCLQNPWLGGLPPPDPRSFCPQLNLLNPPPEKNSWVRHCWTGKIFEGQFGYKTSKTSPIHVEIQPEIIFLLFAFHLCSSVLQFLFSSFCPKCRLTTARCILTSLLMYNSSMVSFDGGSACKVDDVTALPSHIQDGGYALLWQRYDNNKMAAICYYGNVMARTRWRLCVTILHLQQYSHRQLFFKLTFYRGHSCLRWNMWHVTWHVTWDWRHQHFKEFHDLYCWVTSIEQD